MKSFMNIFGIAPELFWKSGTTYKNSFGLGFSIIYYVITTTVLISILLDYFSSENSLNVIKTEKYSSKNLLLNLSEYPMIFGLYDLNGKLINPQNELFSFEIVMRISNIKSADEDKKIDIQLKMCLIENLGKYKKFFLNDKNLSSLNSHFCLAPNQQQLELFDFSENFYSDFSQIEFLILYFNKNDSNKMNTTNNGNITNNNGNGNNNINNNSNNNDNNNFNKTEFLLKLIYFDYDIEPLNKIQAGNLNLKSKLLKFNSNWRSVYNLYYKRIEYNSDNGFLFSNTKTDLFFQQEKPQDFYQTAKPIYLDNNCFHGKNHEVIAQISFRLSKYIEDYRVNSFKFPFAFALLLANIQGIYMIFYLSYYSLCKSLYLFELSEEILYYGNPTKIKECSIFKNHKIKKSFGIK